MLKVTLRGKSIALQTYTRKRLKINELIGRFVMLEEQSKHKVEDTKEQKALKKGKKKR